MSIRVPLNQIKYKFTHGDEYVIKHTNQEYKGHYYEYNNQIFAGKQYDVNASLLVKINEINNTLLLNIDSHIYGRITGLSLSNQKVNSFIFEKGNLRYYSYQINNEVIKEINSKTYELLLLNPLYKTIKLKYPFVKEELNNIEAIIPGMKIFINNTYHSDYFD